MRILQLINRRQRRGAEVFAAELADALALRGHDVLLAGIYPPQGTPLVPEHAGYTDLNADTGSRLSLGTLRRVASLVAQFEPDIVQANGSDTLKYTALPRKSSRGRWRLVYRNISIASRWLRGSLHRAWNRALVARVDHVVAVSETSARDFAGTYALPADRISVIPQAVRIPRQRVNAAMRHRLAELAGVPPTSPILVHVGSFSPEKNHAWMLEAFGDVAGDFPAAHLVLLGDGPLREDIRARREELGLADRVHLLGSRTDASELVAGADVLLLPSLVEGLPGVVLEAAAHGVPAVASDVGGVCEVVRDGETGLLFRSGDRDGFLAAVTSLLADADRRQALGAAARALVEAEYDLDDAVARYETLYHSLARA